MDAIKYTEYVKPPTDKMVSRFDNCPYFDGRKSLLAIEKICWFCKYAKFDLNSDKLPETGICKYPEIQEEKGAKPNS
jgi:hypothetical protein